MKDQCMPINTTGPVASVEAIDALLAAGRLFEAYDRAERAVRADPTALRPAQLRALALARLGRTEWALRSLQELYDAGHHDAETCGLLARVYKDIYRHRGDADAAARSRDLYREGYRLTGAAYPGINAAAMSLVLGDNTEAHAMAQGLLGSLPARTDDLWTAATRGEACLIVGDERGARDAYEHARRLAGNRSGLISTMYQQVRLLDRHCDLPAGLAELLKPPPVLFFTGHMIDRPDRVRPRFPDTLRDAVKQAIAAAIADIGPAQAYASAACGADLLFIEAMDEAGADVAVYLPFAREDFIATSVAHAGESWVRRFHELTDRRDLRYVTAERHFGDDSLFLFLGEVLMGLTLLTAELLSAEPWFLGVLDEKSERRTGGSADLVTRWPRPETMRLIRPADLRRASPPIALGEIHTPRADPPRTDGVHRELRAILFADIVGYSRLTEEETPFFMYDLLGRLADRLHRLHGRPLVLNTWGDAIFALFDDPAAAAECAIALQTLFRREGAGEGRPGMTIRIALHAGPVFIGRDPLTGRDNAYGSHINRAARMEPVTLPGCVYASEQFAGVLRARTGARYRYTYAGTLTLPKGFGAQEMYELSAATSS